MSRQSVRKPWRRIIASGLWLCAAALLPASPMAAGQDERVVTDMVGREVVLSGNVGRIVTTFKPATLCVLSLGLQERIVGIDASSRRDRLNRAIHPDVDAITSVGSKSAGINIETVVALDPQLVLLYAQKDGVVLADRLQSMGIPAIIILPESFESIRESLRIIARAVGDPQRLSRTEEAMHAVLAVVEQAVGDIAVDDRRTAYFAAPRGVFCTATGNMLQDEILSRAGVVNVAHELSGYFQDISPEQFLQWNPEIVILSQTLSDRDVQPLENAPINSVRAVAARAVYRCPSDLSPWDFPSPLSVLATLWVASKAYPERFVRVDVAAEVDRFHERLFGLTFTQMNGRLNDLVY